VSYSWRCIWSIGQCHCHNFDKPLKVMSTRPQIARPMTVSTCPRPGQGPGQTCPRQRPAPYLAKLIKMRNIAWLRAYDKAINVIIRSYYQLFIIYDICYVARAVLLSNFGHLFDLSFGISIIITAIIIFIIIIITPICVCVCD